MKNKLLLAGVGLVIIGIGYYLWTAKTAPTEDLEYSEAGEETEEMLANEPKNINAEGTIIGYRTYARYVVLGDDEKATLRGWVIEGPESEGVPPVHADEVTTSPHKYDIGQRVAFSGELVPGLSDCRKENTKYFWDDILEAGIQTAPLTNQQCFGWVDADRVELD